MASPPAPAPPTPRTLARQPARPARSTMQRQHSASRYSRQTLLQLFLAAAILSAAASLRTVSTARLGRGISLNLHAGWTNLCSLRFHRLVITARSRSAAASRPAHVIGGARPCGDQPRHQQTDARTGHSADGYTYGNSRSQPREIGDRDCVSAILASTLCDQACLAWTSHSRHTGWATRSDVSGFSIKI